MNAIERARLSLEGLSVGDAFGETFFSHPNVVDGLIEQRALAPPPWRWTDDTQMAISVVEVLERFGEIDSDTLVDGFVRRYERERGYGPAMHAYLRNVGDGASWREEASGLFGGQGSFGNGSAMRITPLGAFYAEHDWPTIIEQAVRSSEVTHTHSEATAGAIAVAVTAAMAWRLREAKAPIPPRADLLTAILEHVPDSIVRERIRHARDLDASASVRLAVAALGNGTGVAAQDTVPFTLWCATGHLDDFEEALWRTVSGLGDRDTTCAIVGGIVALYTGIDGIPPEWRAARETIEEAKR